MNVGEWLHSRTPRPPIALTDRLHTLLDDLDLNDAPSIPAALEQAGDRLLGDLLRRQASARESALDLLAADALMTYLMESAAGDIGTLDAQAQAAMSRISAILDGASATA
jgi:hypothetical protein